MYMCSIESVCARFLRIFACRAAECSKHRMSRLHLIHVARIQVVSTCTRIQVARPGYQRANAIHRAFVSRDKPTCPSISCV